MCLSKMTAYQHVNINSFCMTNSAFILPTGLAGFSYFGTLCEGLRFGE